MVTEIVLGFFFIWLILLSWIIFRAKSHYRNLVDTTKKVKLDQILELLINDDKKFASELSIIKKKLVDLTDKQKFYFKKIGIVNFNPFGRSGGEQGLVVALLNEENSGLIINFIYTRDGLRVYTKQVKNSKGEKHELSEEEKKAIATSY